MARKTTKKATTGQASKARGPRKSKRASSVAPHALEGKSMETAISNGEKAPLNLEDLIASQTVDLQRQIQTLIYDTIMRIAQRITVYVGEEAQRKAAIEMRSRVESALGPGAVPADFALTGSWSGGTANRQLQLVQPEPAKTTGKSAGSSKSRKGQKWSAECPFPKCPNKAIRSKMNFCTEHALLDQATKTRLRNEQKARKMGAAT